MRRSPLFLAVPALVLAPIAVSMFAQAHEEGPALNTCIKEFYDPGMYNYLTYRNSCAQSLTVVFVAKDGSGRTGSMDLRPGASDSVGRSASGAVPKVGAFELYVCQMGYVPVDENNKVVKKPQTTFQCKPRGQ